MIKIENAKKSFGSLEVLKQVDLTIQPGEVVSILVGLTQKPSKQTDCEAPDVGSPTARNA